MMVNPSVPAKTVPEFIAYQAIQPGSHVARPASGATNHVPGEMFQMMAGVKTRFTFPIAAGASFPDLLGGQVQITFNPLPSSLDFIRSGKLRGLAVTSARRRGRCRISDRG